MISNIVGIIGTIFIIGILVFVHELGHFIAARKTGVKALEFAFGFGPRFISIRKLKTGFRINIVNKIKFKIPFKGKEDETLYKINFLPLGGYVKMLGEENNLNDPRAFSSKSISKRFIILVAGVVMNVILGVVIYSILVASAGFVYNLPNFYSDISYKFVGANTIDRVNIGEVVTDSPAEEAGLEARDLIVSIAGTSVNSMQDVSAVIDEYKGERVEFVLQRGHKREIVETEALVRADPPEGQGAVGIKMYESIDLDYSSNIFTKALSGVSNSVNVMSFQLKSIGVLIVEAIKTRDANPVTDNVTGIVGIVSVTTSVIRFGTLADILDITALLSLSIAFMNILPLPLLDGGYISLLGLEKIRGKKLSNKAMEWYLRVGLIAIILLTFFITVKDIRQFELFEGIKDLFS